MKYFKPKIKKVIQYICEKNNLNEEDVINNILIQFPELTIKERCFNCEASMAMYEFNLDILDLLLLQGMGRIIRERMVKGVDFTTANQIHLQTELNDYYLVPSRSTQCAKLGLVAKVRHKDGSHNQKAGWCVTRRGFECLQDKPVPKSVVTFRNKIVERGTETTTMTEVYSQYKGKEYGEEIAKHSPNQWYNVDSYFPNDFIDSEEVDID